MLYVVRFIDWLIENVSVFSNGHAHTNVHINDYKSLKKYKKHIEIGQGLCNRPRNILSALYSFVKSWIIAENALVWIFISIPEFIVKIYYGIRNRHGKIAGAEWRLNAMIIGSVCMIDQEDERFGSETFDYKFN